MTFYLLFSFVLILKFEGYYIIYYIGRLSIALSKIILQIYKYNFMSLIFIDSSEISASILENSDKAHGMMC